MQRFRALATARRCLSSFRCAVASRGFSARPAAATDGEPVLVEGGATSRTAVLHRPASLNSLNAAMGSRLTKLYECWEENPDIGFVVMKGRGRAFCAGGDVVTLYRLLSEGKVEGCKDFFRILYHFIYILGTYLKPHVAILDGITMGGGGGVSIPGTFRLATDKTIFSTPEAIIGFHPDAGASFYLSHLPGHLGEYLALTGEKLDGLEMLACGLATHYYPSEKLDWIDHHLSTLVTDDPSVIETSLEQYGDMAFPDKESVIRRMETVDKCFGHDTVEEIIAALESEACSYGNEWCKSALRKLKDASPLALKVSLQSIHKGRLESLDQCLIREYRMSLHLMLKHVSNDFCEGVRARLIDKDFAPKWDPPTLGHVSQDMVDQYFSPLADFEPELELPLKVREPFI